MTLHLFLLLVVAAAQVGDVLTTRWLLARGGRELNPLMRWAMARAGALPALCGKAAALTALAAWAGEFGAGVLAVISVAVLLHNYASITRTD
jgi:hypothetical protein